MYNIYTILLAMVPPLVYVWVYIWITNNPDNGMNLLKGISSWKRERREKIIKKYGAILADEFEKKFIESEVKQGYSKKRATKVLKMTRKDTERRLGEMYAEYVLGKPDETETFF